MLELRYAVYRLLSLPVFIENRQPNDFTFFVVFVYSMVTQFLLPFRIQRLQDTTYPRQGKSRERSGRGCTTLLQNCNMCFAPTYVTNLQCPKTLQRRPYFKNISDRWTDGVLGVIGGYGVVGWSLVCIEGGFGPR